MGDPKNILFEEVYYLGVRVLRVNGINLLDRGSLDSILQADDKKNTNSFHEVNQWKVPFGYGDILQQMYGFATAFNSDSHKWLYYETTVMVNGGTVTAPEYKLENVGGKYAGTEINYIIAGHAAAKAGLSTRKLGQPLIFTTL